MGIEAQVARHFVSEFQKRIQKEYVDYFERLGFTAETVKIPNTLFRFLTVISYDMRPLNYKQVWGPPHHLEYADNSIREKLDEGDISLEKVRLLSRDFLSEKLHELYVIRREGEKEVVYRLDRTDNINHATGLKQLGEVVDTLANMLSETEATGQVAPLHSAIDRVHGFGAALSSKVILFLVRCFGIGWKKADPTTLRPIAEGLRGEYHVGRGVDRMVQSGIQFAEFMNELTKQGDPFAVELLYLLEASELTEILHESPQQRTPDLAGRILAIVEEIVEGAQEVAEKRWAVKTGYGSMMRASAEKLLRNMRVYARNNDVDGMWNYYLNAMSDERGRKVGALLVQNGKKSLESEFQRVKSVYRPKDP